MYSTGQAAVQHVALRPLRGRRRDSPPGIVQQPAARPIREPEEDREEERELLAGGDANNAVQPRNHVGRDGNQVNQRGNCTNQQTNTVKTHQRAKAPGRERMNLYIETLRNADSHYSGDETDTLPKDVDEGLTQHVEEEPLSNGSKEENVTSAMKQTHPAYKEHKKSDNKDNEASENTQRPEVNIVHVIYHYRFLFFSFFVSTFCFFNCLNH